MCPVRHFAEERQFLFEINAHPAEENGNAAALILFVQRHWQVEGNHEDIVSLATELGHKRIIAKAIPAIHAPRARRYLNDSHDSISQPLPAGRINDSPAPFRPLRVGFWPKSHSQ